MFGSYEDGYKWIPKVLEQIKKKNRGSIGVVATDMDKYFSYCCLSFKAYLEGFKNGCRPFIGLDGCHLNGKYGGVLLSAVALDGNNGMYPLAIFICDCENKENWILFLNLIKDMLLEHPAPLTFISDRQKGLIPAIQIVFPSNRTRYWFRHMYENFKTKHKGVHMKTLAWGATKAYRDTDHTRYMALMEKDNKKAHQWFEDVPTIQWARSTFDHTSKCEHVTNNFTECLNSWLVELRCKPIHMILEGFNLKMMNLMFDRKMIAKKWEAEGLILVPIDDRIMKNIINLKRRYQLFGSEEYIWCVMNYLTSRRWEVNLTKKTCTCCVWEITGIPCVHVVAVACHLRMDPNSLVEEYHKVSAYKKAYGGRVEPCASQDGWIEMSSAI
ncbi:uncharacterized protein LOC113272293 [Papaver somniferum]|uniref:uncharacterized protein LOC113272293 n=1 Tax=Papaver somniferum TaxID=3469 RepID=UPI000E6FF2EF|nr:uncharacterized protein LOC113272293 [Papaver somniferum]